MLSIYYHENYAEKIKKIDKYNLDYIKQMKCLINMTN